MISIKPSEIKTRAEAYINERTETSGVPFPLTGQHRELAIMLMAGFACIVLAEELSALLSDKEH